MKNKEFVSLELHLEKGFFCSKKKFEKMLYLLTFEFQGESVEIHKLGEKMNIMKLFYYVNEPLSPEKKEDLQQKFYRNLVVKLEEMKKQSQFSSYSLKY